MARLSLDAPLPLAPKTRPTLARTLRRGLLAASAALSLAACATTEPGGSMTGAATALPQAGQGEASEAAFALAGLQATTNPENADAAIAFSRGLRQRGQIADAVTTMAPAVSRFPDHAGVMAEYGRALVAAGRADDALPFLARASALAPRDVRLIAAEGAALDQVGRHADAQMRYRAALALQPGDASVLNNLGLSYMLSGDPSRARQTLEQAVAAQGAAPKVQQNLAVVLALSGERAGAARAAMPQNARFVDGLVAMAEVKPAQRPAPAPAKPDAAPQRTSAPAADDAYPTIRPAQQ